MIRSDVLLTGRMRWARHPVDSSRPAAKRFDQPFRPCAFVCRLPSFFRHHANLLVAGPPKGYHVTVVTLSLSSSRT